MSQFSNDDDQEFSFDLDSIIDLVQVDQVKTTFFEESKTLLSNLEDLIQNLEKKPQDLEIVETLFRKVHTLKGNVGAIPGGQLVGSIAHEFETVLVKIKDAGVMVNEQLIDIFFKSARLLTNLIKSLQEQRELYPEELSAAIELISEYGALVHQQGDGRSLNRQDRKEQNVSNQQGIWLSSEVFENFMKISGELLVLKNSFTTLKKTNSPVEDLGTLEKREEDFFLNLSKISDQLQNQIKKASQEKAKVLFKGLQVLVRQISTDINKDVQFEIIGEEVLLDKFLAREIYDSLVHILRNSLDHGIEDQFERATAGKLPKGLIQLEVENQDKEIVLKITDDGVGLKRSKIGAKALAKGLVNSDQLEKMSDDEVYAFIFEHGFSTRDKVTTLSGRGVGMDVVKTTVDRLKGSLVATSIEGQGMNITIRIPHLQHIQVESVLLCHWNDKLLAIPIQNIETVTLSEELAFNRLSEGLYAQVLGQSVLASEYSDLWSRDFAFNQQSGCLIVLKAKGHKIGLYVDKVEQQTEIVIKEFGDLVQTQIGCKGISVLSDERIVYVIDPDLYISEFSNSLLIEKLEAA